MRKSTKEKILDAALDLFSEKGYDGVGVDLIAEKAGIKGPSVYKHFKGKEEILNELLNQVEVYYQKNFGAAKSEMSVPSSMAELETLALKKLNFTMHDPVIRKVRRILTIEQFRNPVIAELATKHTVTGTLEMFQEIFSGMMAKGILKEADPEILAMEFTLPVTVYIQMCDRHPEQEAEIMEKIQKHLKHFTSVYGEIPEESNKEPDEYETAEMVSTRMTTASYNS